MTAKKQETTSPSTKTIVTAQKQKNKANTNPKFQEKSPDEELEDFKAELFNEAQNEMSDLTSIFSNVARTLMFGIIGTIWIITYSEAGLDFPNGWLFAALSLCLFYFLVDVIHYFCSAMIYQDISKKAKDSKSFREYLVQKKRTYKNNRRTVICVIIKFAVLIIAAVAFCIGLYAKMA